MVQVRANPRAPWLVAAQGMEAMEGAEFRTGPHSSVTCIIPPDQIFTLDRLGVVAVSEAIQRGNKVTTKLVMPYGRTSLQLQSSGREYDTRLISPSSTLAVRGTTVSLYDQPPFEVEATSFTGRAMFRTYQREVAVGSKGGSKASVVAAKTSAAGTARDRATVDPVDAKSRTPSEAQLLAAQPSTGGVSGVDPKVYEASLAKTLRGPLAFTLTWVGNAKIDLEILFELTDPLNSLIRGLRPNQFVASAIGLNETNGGVHTTGQRTLVIQKGGLRVNTEQVFFDKIPPLGVFSIGAVNLSTLPTVVTIDAFVNGKKGQLFFLDQNGSFQIANEETGTVKTRGDFLTADFTIPELFPGSTDASAARARHDKPRHTPAEAAAAPKPTPTVSSRRTGR